MDLKNTEDEIDYDKLVEYELSCLDDEIILDDDNDDSSFLENDIAENDSVEMTLEKISKAHEDFYKMCFENIKSNNDTINNENNSNADKLTEKRNGILNSYNLTYDDFVRKVSEIENEFVNDIENEKEKLSELALGDVTQAQSSIQTLFDHEKVINELNEENWDNYQKFYLEYSERCQSARSSSQKQLKEEAHVEKQRRQDLKVILDEQLKNLEMRMKDEELDNKVRLEELEAEIQQEKKLLVKLKTDSREMLIMKKNWAAIMIQKHFRKYRIRKRIGSKIDEVRQNARRKLLNTKYIINEKLAQKQRANELRKWKKEKMLKEKSDKLEKGNLENETQLILINNDTEQSGHEVCNINEDDVGKKKQFESEQYCPENKLNVIHDINEKHESKCEDIIVDEIKEAKLCEENLSIPVESSFEEPQLMEIKNTDLKVNNENKTNKLIVDETNVHKTENTDDENLSTDNEYIEKNEIFNLLAMQTNNNNLDLNDPEDIDREIKDFARNPSHLTICSDDDITKDAVIKEPANDNDEDDRCIKYNENNDSTIKLLINNTTVIQDESPTLEKKEIINNENKNDLLTDNDDKNESGKDDCVQVNETSNSPKSTDEYHDILICQSNHPDFVKTENMNLRNDTIEDVNPNTVSVIPSDENKCKFNHDEVNCENETVDMGFVSLDNNIERELQKTDFGEDEKLSMIDTLAKNESQNLLSDLSVSLQPNEKPSINSIKEEFLESIFKRNEKILKLCVSWMKQNMEQDNQNCCSKEITNRMERTIPSVPKHLNESVNFTIENIDQNAIVTDPDCKSWTSSKSLSITDSPLDCISNIKESFPNIEHLKVCHTSLASFHSTDAPDSLKYLNINKNKLEWAYFGNSIHSCLTILSCSSNDISDLPPAAFQNCNNILHIDFSNNNFLSIEDIFKGNEALKSLCSINLSNNVLSSIDNLDMYCPNLTHINLSSNHLKNWSNAYKFPYLIDCDLSHNSLISLESWINTPIIVYLNLSHNSINNVESFVDSWMPCLVTLQLDSNKLKEIPDFLFLSLQNLSIQRNYLNDSVNFEKLFQNSPLLSFIDMKGNMGSFTSKIRTRDGKIVDNVNDTTIETQTPCPDGDFAAACFDFADSIQQKSLRFLKIIKSSSDSELIYKHQFHYYRCIREVAEDFYLWMRDFLFCSNSCSALVSEDKYSEIHIASAIKIQAYWKGYRTRRWYKSFISNIKSDIEKCFDELGPVDIDELDQLVLIKKLNQIDEFPKPTSAWLENSKLPEYGVQKISKYEVSHQPENDELIISGNESTYRSNTSSLLNKKGMEIMKEWGFEDPRSAFWIMERAKKFQRKIDKNIKPLNASNKRNIANISPKPPQYPTKICISPDYKKPQDHPKHSSVQLNTVTLQPPNSSQFSNYRSKIDEWLSDSKFTQDIPSASDVDKKSFLPVIVESENQVKKIPPTLIRPKSSSTKLPSIN